MKKAEFVSRLTDIKTQLTNLRDSEDHAAWVDEGTSNAAYHSGKSAGLNKAIKLIDAQLSEVQ